MMAGRKLSIANPLAELRKRQEADLERRRHGEGLLLPDAMRPGSKSPVGVLWTTLGGHPRVVTPQDLAAFRRNVAALGDKLAKGITVQELIDGSLAEDIQRARQEIRTAMPTRLTGGDVLVVTSSGPHSNVTRHFARFVFENYGNAVARPETPLQAARWLTTHGRMRIECDCGRWTFWLRYVATIGGYAAGRVETGYPKIRNPELRGVACKHLLRAAVELQSATARALVGKMIEADRARLDAAKAPPRPKVITVSRAQADTALAAQAKRARTIATTSERQRRALFASLRKAGGPRRSADVHAQLADTVAALQQRGDISAQAILQALQSVLRQQPQGAPK